ncbi:MAG: hypothetical protein JWM30_74 [Burkholderia sp.]|nr:hypothetical protein [Burkholderia sp.]
MKRSLNAIELTNVRPFTPVTSDQPEPNAQQALTVPVANTPTEPAATEHAPMVFPGPFAHVPRPAAMQVGPMQPSSTSIASSGQDCESQASVVPNAMDKSQGKAQVGSLPAFEACSTSTTSSVSVPAPDATNDHPHGFSPLIAGAQLDLASDPQRLAALIGAARRGDLAVVQMLVKRKDIALDQMDDKGWSALHYASASNKPDVVKCLLAAGAQVNLETAGQRLTPLMHAATRGYVEVMNVLLARRDIAIHALDEKGLNALHWAADKNKPHAVACLLDAGAHVNFACRAKKMTALIAAACGGHLELVQMLVKRKDIALDQMDGKGWSALHYASVLNKPDVVKCLLAAGAQVNLGTAEQRLTPLMQAAYRGYVEVMKALLARRDIAIDAPDAKGLNALHWAADNNKPDAVACLLVAGARMTLPDSSGRSALAIAIQNRSVAVLEVLSHHGATLPGIDQFDAAHAAYTVTVADLAADLKLPADPQQNPLGLVAPDDLDQPVAVIDKLVAALESGQDLQRWLRAKGFRMAGALPVVECLSALASTWPATANNRQAATAQHKRLVCAAALSRLSVLAGKGQALENYKQAGISAAALERLSAVATRQIDRTIAISEQVLTSSGGAMLDKLIQDCLAKTNFTDVDTDALSASLVTEGWLAPLAQAIVRAWAAALASLAAEPLAIREGSTVKQVAQDLREHIETKAPRLFAQAMQRELGAQTLVTALRTWIGGARAAEGLHMLFQIQCDQFRQYCEQLGRAG